MKLCCFYFTTRLHGKLLEWWSTTPGCTIDCTEKLKQRLNLVVQGHINVLIMTNLVISVSASQYKRGSKVHRAISSPNIPRTFETIYLTRLRSSVPPLTVQVSSFPACLSLLNSYTSQFYLIIISSLDSTTLMILSLNISLSSCLLAYI